MKLTPLIQHLLLLSSLTCFCGVSNAETTPKSDKKTQTHHNSKKHQLHIAPPQHPLTTTGEQLVKIGTLADKNMLAAQTLANRFKGTPLEAYANYQLLKDTVNNPKNNDAISHYIQQFPDTSWANTLTQRWSELLENRQDWTTITANQAYFTQGNSRCAVLSALYNTQAIASTDWLNETSQRWLTDHTPTPSCSTLYKQLENSQLLDENLWRQKLANLYAEGNIDAAKNKQNYLPASLQAYNQTMTNLLSGNLAENARYLLNQMDHTAMNEGIAPAFNWLIRLLLKREPETALSLWNDGKSRLNLTDDEIRQTEKQLYVQLAKKNPDQKIDWLTKIDPQVHDETTVYPLIQAALATSDWERLLTYISWLPEAQQQSDSWQYWRAKALTQTNNDQQAQSIYAALAQKRSYYGFMAADKLGQSYQLNSQFVTAEQLANAHQSMLGQRLQALYEAGLKEVAWKEWSYAKNTGKVSLDAVPGYAQLAQSWGWHSFAALSLGNPAHWNYTTLRFSTPYQGLLTPNATNNNIPLAWAYGIMRRESAYAYDVKSSSGAMGLMQLMPKTAKALAPIHNLTDVYQPELNVQLGTKLLGQLKREFNGNLVLATASYNAGGFRVKQWLKQLPNVPNDQWIELIPFKETRDYVKAVMEYMLVFERLGMATEKTRLSEYLVPVQNPMLLVENNKCNPATQWCL